MLRHWYPGMDPLENSHLRNRALFEKGNARNSDPTNPKSLGREWEAKAAQELEMQLRAGIIPGESPCP